MVSFLCSATSSRKASALWQCANSLLSFSTRSQRTVLAPIFSQIEQLHDQLIRGLGFTLLQNIILSFVQESVTNSSNSHIVELCFLYLLRLFGSNPKEMVHQYAAEVPPLLHFLYECLYNPCFLPVSSTDESISQAGITQIQTQENVLMDYVMSLFALLCYNCFYFCSLIM